MGALLRFVLIDGGGNVASHELVDLLIRYRWIRDDAEERLHRIDGIRLAHPAAQHATFMGFDRTCDLVGFNLEDGITRIDPGAVLQKPTRHLAFLHGEAPLGHDDGHDALVTHLPVLNQFVQWAIDRDTALAMASAEGM